MKKVQYYWNKQSKANIGRYTKNGVGRALRCRLDTEWSIALTLIILFGYTGDNIYNSFYIIIY